MERLFTSGYQRYTLEQAFEDASRFGYDYIELWGGYPHAYVEDLTARGVGEIDRLIQKYRMPVKCFTPEHNGYPFNYMAGDEFQWERSMVYLEKAIESGHGRTDDAFLGRSCRVSDDRT